MINTENKSVLEAVEVSKKIIKNMIAKNFGDESLAKAEEILDTIELDIDNNPETAEKCGGYFNGEKVYIAEKTIKDHQKSIELIKVIIHEYAHAFSRIASKGELTEVNSIVEESIANIFAEASINQYIIDGFNIPYISEQEYEQLKEKGYTTNTLLESYVAEGHFTRGIMYALQQKGKDLNAINDYLFGDKQEFINKCEDVLGTEVSSLLLEQLSGVVITIGINNSGEFLIDAYATLSELLEKYVENFSEECISRKEGQLYSVEIPLLEQFYYDKKIQKEWAGRKLDLDNLTLEDIRNIAKNSDGKIIELCQGNIYGNYIKKLVSAWYKKTNGKLEEFDEILSITGKIPFEQVITIINDQTNQDDRNNILDMLFKYYIPNNDEFGIEDGKVINYLLKKFKSEKQYDDSVAETSILPLLRNSDINDQQFRRILETYYCADIDVNSLEDIETSYQILNIFENMKKTEEIAIYEDIIKSKIFDNIGNVPQRFQDSMEKLRSAGFNITNQDEILEKIKNNGIKDLQIKIDEQDCNWQAFVYFDDVQLLFQACLNQFMQEMDDEGFENYATCSNLLLLQKDFKDELGINDKKLMDFVTALKTKIKNDRNITAEQREMLEEEIKQIETDLMHNAEQQEKQPIENDTDNKRGLVSSTDIARVSKEYGTTITEVGTPEYYIESIEDIELVSDKSKDKGDI